MPNHRPKFAPQWSVVQCLIKFILKKMQKEVEGHVTHKVYVTVVNETELAFHKPEVTGAELLIAAGFEHLQCHTLYQKLKGCDFNKVALDDVINLADEGIERFVTKGPEVFNYEVNGEPETTDKKELTPNQIMQLKGIHPHNHYLVQLLHDGERIVYTYCADESIKMDCRGMKFVTEKWLDIVNVEEYGKHCKTLPPARIYRIKVDKGYHDWPKPFITVPELIHLEYPTNAKPVEVYKFLNTSPKPIKLKGDETVDLNEKCLVRFTIQPKEQEDGLSPEPAQKEVIQNGVKIRKDFTLPEEDEEFLDSLGLLWEAVGNQPGMWVIIHDYPIPTGYNVQKAEVALAIVGTYPAAQIDMAYFLPPLVKDSRRIINNVFEQPLDGKKYQGWSRHRKTGEWRPGVDCIATHFV